MKYTVKKIQGKYNPNNVFATYEEATKVAQMNNMHSNATYAVYEIINLNGREALRKVRNH
jgi:hypothetical protein